MARDHRRLRVFHRARNLGLEVYRETMVFPADERFGLTSQMRRAAISIGSNIVEGCARRTEGDFLRFMDMALGSARELQFHAEMAQELGFLVDNGRIADQADEVGRLLHRLIRAIQPKHLRPAPQDPGPKTQDPK